MGKKKLKSGKVSLYLNYCYNSKRKKEYLGLLLDPSEGMRERNQEVMNKAVEILKERTADWISKNVEWGKQCSERHDFFTIAAGYAAGYKRSDYRMLRAVLGHLRKFVPNPVLPVKGISKQFCRNFFTYLFTKLHGSTAQNYFKKFRACLDSCVELELIPKNPSAGIRLSYSDGITKEILTVEELRRLASTPCRHSEVKRAFLFSCYTGLRWCDVVRLTYHSVDFSDGMLHFVQCKVRMSSRRALLHLALNRTALRLLRIHSGIEEDRVFRLPSYNRMLCILKQWVAHAGITKHITYHCARHSFISHLMFNGVNIKTASELAGHSSIRHTERYVHTVDDLKRKAVDSLPELTF